MRKFVFFLLLLFMGMVLMAWAVFDDRPAVEPSGHISRGDLLWAKQLIERNVPRDSAAGTLQTLQLSEEDLNRMLSYAVVVKRVSGVQAELRGNRLSVNMSLRIPESWFGHYVNIAAEFSPQAGFMELDSMQVGSLPLPAILGRAVLKLARGWLVYDPAYASLIYSVARVSVRENHLNVDYHWQPQLLTMLERKGVQALVGEDEKQRLLAYAGLVRELVANYPRTEPQPLHDLMARLFSRAAPNGEDIAAENRAALTALGAYVAGLSLPQLLEGQGKSTRRAPTVLLSLHGRRDSAEHLLIAAALSVNAGSQLANAMGLAKEEDDTVSGSGFSFTDLAYDRAGAMLGELATGQAASRVRQELGVLKNDGDLAPAYTDLPEFMPQAEFVRRFEKVGSDAYLWQVIEIERRLKSHPLYRR